MMAMDVIRHPIRRHEALTEGRRYSHVTLPAIPGVELTPDRPETDPRTRTIRRAKPKRTPAGIALAAAAMRRVQWVREALAELDE